MPCLAPCAPPLPWSVPSTTAGCPRPRSAFAFGPASALHVRPPRRRPLPRERPTTSAPAPRLQRTCPPTRAHPRRGRHGRVRAGTPARAMTQVLTSEAISATHTTSRNLANLARSNAPIWDPPHRAARYAPLASPRLSVRPSRAARAWRASRRKQEHPRAPRRARRDTPRDRQLLGREAGHLTGTRTRARGRRVFRPSGSPSPNNITRTSILQPSAAPAPTPAPTDPNRNRTQNTSESEIREDMHQGPRITFTASPSPLHPARPAPA